MSWPSLRLIALAADWELLPDTVAHAFTHFRLELSLAVARVDGHGPIGDWWDATEMDSAGLPTVFAKAATAIRRARW